MSYYRRNRPGASRSKRIFVRILFVLVAALIITILSVLMGIYLRHKVDSAEAMEYDYPIGEESETPVLPVDSVTLDPVTVFGAGLNPTEYGSEDEIVLSIHQLAEYYDTLTLPLTDTTGRLMYTSPALCEAMRMAAPDENPVLDRIVSAVTAGRAKNMRICGLLTPSGNAELDSVLVNELAEAGFDEILFTPDFGESINYLQANDFRALLNRCRSDASVPVSIGVLLKSAHYLRTADAKQIQMIASAADFLGVTFEAKTNQTTTDAYRTVTGEISSMLGSFSVYHMRVILSDSEKDVLSAKIKACTDKDIRSISITSAALPTEMIFSDEYQESQAAETDSPRHSAETGETNPYSGGSLTYPSYKDVTPETDTER